MLSKEQYAVIEPLYIQLRQEKGDYVNADELIARIEADPEISAIVFAATPEEVYQRYRRMIVCEFIRMWEAKKAETIAARVEVRMPQSVASSNKEWCPAPIVARSAVEYAPVMYAYKDELLAKSVKKYYEHGLCEVKRYAIYCESWGQSVVDLVAELEEAIQDIRQAVEKKPELVTV